MQPAGTFEIPHSHPSLPGHFPGRPVVPGVVLLEETLACLPPGMTLLTAKFTAPVRPCEVVTVSSEPTGAGRVAFACATARGQVLRGTAGAAP